jgi:hypothetical protein
VDLTVSPEPHLFPLSLPLLLLLFLLRARGCLGKNRGFEVTMGDSGRLTICYSLLALWDCSSLNLGLNLGLVFGLGSELELTCRTFGLDMDHGNSKPDLTCRGMGLALYTGHNFWCRVSNPHSGYCDGLDLACRTATRTSDLGPRTSNLDLEL